MPYQLLTGKVNKLEHTTETSGSIQTSALSGRTYGNISSSHAWSFRIDNRAVNLKSGHMGSLSEGDIVTAVGKESNTGFDVIALRNETTGAKFTNSPIPWYVFGGILILVGWAFGLGGGVTFVLVGGPWIALGLWIGNTGRRIATANNMLHAAPKAAPKIQAPG